MLALIVYTTLTIAGMFLLIGKHAQNGVSYQEDMGDAPVLTAILANLMVGGLIWWVVASIPNNWATTTVIVLAMFGAATTLARAFLTDGVYRKHLAITLIGFVVSAIVISGLWASALGA
jgi:hypothetical protein